MSCGKRSYQVTSYGKVGGNVTAAAAGISSSRKKKKYNRGTTFVPPTKFLLGGNIRDPLNLNGLQGEDDDGKESKVGEDVTLPISAEFLLGGNINDPLNLKGIADQNEASVGAAESEAPPAEKKRKVEDEKEDEVATDKHEETVAASDDAAPAESSVSVSQEVVEDGPKTTVESRLNGAKPTIGLQLNVIDRRKLDRKDKIVSPVIPQPYRPLKTVPFRQIITPDLGTKASKTPKFREKNTRFQYGNDRRYYVNRNGGHGTDLRLEILEKHREFFEEKDVLDVGCNVGHIALAVARGFGARSVTGMDIDRYLVDIAKRNVQYYVTCPSPYSTAASPNPAAIESTSNRKVDLKYKCYPVSMPILYGPIIDQGELRNERRFPKNVRFVHGNYVPESETMLLQEQPQYDTILCLSVTKWIHLNWGDEGLRLAFKRMYAQLRPGGILIIEPQSWDSYKKKKSLTETIWRNYRAIQLFPHHFDRYLLSSEVGFSRCQTLAVVNHQLKGFRRAIKVFKKPMTSVRSTASPSVPVAKKAS